MGVLGGESREDEGVYDMIIWSDESGRQ